MDYTEQLEISRIESFESICKKIHDSCGDEGFLVQVLCSLSQHECRKIRESYMNVYREDLLETFEKIDSSFSSLMLNPFERDAIVAREALFQNISINYKALMEIFTCRKSSHVLLILQAYLAKYRTHLDFEISTIESPHPYQKILMALSASHKAHHAEISQHIAKCDAKRLYQTGEAKAGAIDEAVVLEIFSKRSIAQLQLTFLCYKHIYGHSYTNFLKNHDSGEFEDTVRAVTKCICSPPKYYAKTLYGCLCKNTTDRGTLARIMVSRAEVDMDEIRRIFKVNYGTELKNVIFERIPQGTYRDFIVTLAMKKATC